MRIGGIIIFHLGKLWQGKFFILCGVIFLVRLQEKFEVDQIEVLETSSRVVQPKGLPLAIQQLLGGTADQSMIGDVVLRACFRGAQPCHPEEWSISNFPCSLTRNITSHSMKNMNYHSLLTTSLIRFSWKGWENVFFELGSDKRSVPRDKFIFSATTGTRVSFNIKRNKPIVFPWAV